MTTRQIHVGNVMAASSPDRPLVRHAVVIADDVIEAIVPADQLTAPATASVSAVEVNDHGDALISPGFVDAHVHLGQIGTMAGSLDLHGTRSLDDVLDLVRTRARTQPDGAIIGLGWDDTTWAPGARPPSRADLDRVAPGRLVYLARVDVHSAVVSPALAEAASALSTTAGGPPLDALDGYRADGTVARAAHHLVRDAVAETRSREDRRAALSTALTMAAGRGLVAVHELGAPHLSDPDDMRLIAELTAAGATPAVTTYWGEHADTGGVQRAIDLGCAGAAGDLSADGAIGSRTAALRADYSDAAGHRGSLYLDAAATYRHVRACTLAGVQAGFHAIGDAAVDAVVTGLRAVVAELGVNAVRACRHRVEHLELWPTHTNAADRQRVADDLAIWGVVASMQPEFDGWWGGPGELYEQRLGVDRATGMNPLATLLAAGVTVAYGSDAPVTPMAPWAGVRAAIGHHTPSERVSLADALTAHTIGGWLAAGSTPEAAVREGSLAAGHAANLAVWDVADLASATAVGADPQCLVTLRRGRRIHGVTRVST